VSLKMPPQTRYARNGDVHIAFQTFGEGPVDLLYVPQSFSVSEHLWDHPAVSRFFARMSGFARVIAFDRRESGMSDRFGRPPTLEEQMDDVIAVLDAAEADRVGIFAMLEGGPMAMMFAATHPERTGALMLYATFARTTCAPGYEWAPTVAEREIGQKTLIERWGDGSITEHFAPSHSGDRRLRDWVGALQRFAMAPSGALALNDMNMHLDVRPILPSIRVPTLVMHREGDVAINPLHSQFLARNIPGARLKMLPGVDNFPFLGDVDSVLGEMEEFLTGARHTQDRDRVLATVLLSDIVKSTERAAELGDRVWRDLLRDHHEDAARTVSAFSGRLIKSTGDGILATFDGPARAIRAGDMLVQEAHRLGVEVRVGLHTGELELLGDDVSGMAVHIAARVMDRAGPSEVVVSSTVRDLVVGSRLDFEDRGTHELRGVPGDWRLWSLTG
jgi:class 3 adenylate cyclase/pimeloyl-ACP methyl ester carboxylesterase